MQLFKTKKIVTNWKRNKLGDFAHVQTGPFGSQLHASDYVAIGIPSIMPVNIVDHKIEEAGIARINAEDAKRLSKYLVATGDIVFSRRGEIHRRAIITYKENGWLCGTGCLRARLRSTDEVDPQFLYFYLGIDEVRDWLYGHAVGTSMPNLNSGILSNLPIALPDLPIQRRIAEILSALDDKIELNRRMNQTLEQMAQTLFRQYFVDGIDEENLPEGWRWGKIIDLFELQRGFDLPATKRIAGSVPVFAAGGLNGFHNEVMVKGPGITTGRSGVIGNVFYIPEDFWPLNTSLFIKKYNESTPLHAFYVLKHTDLKGLNSGSAVPTLNRNEVHTLEVLVPAKEAILKFEGEAKLLFQKIRHNEKQITTLTQLRDTLLPKLMSGEIDVMQTKPSALYEPVLS